MAEAHLAVESPAHHGNATMSTTVTISTPDNNEHSENNEVNMDDDKEDNNEHSTNNENSMDVECLYTKQLHARSADDLLAYNMELVDIRDRMDLCNMD